MAKNNWNNTHFEMFINTNEVHIYYVSVNSVKQIIFLLEPALTNEEKSKISKFVFEKDRIIQTLSRAVLKSILSRYIPVNPESINISTNEYGKPFIGKHSGRETITFNLSHSGDMIVYAVSENREVGIDVEVIKDIDSVDDLINQNFSVKENNMLHSLTGHEKTTAFYSCWTKKEAYVKALGRGLSYPLSTFTVSVFPGEENALLHDENNDISQWSLRDIQLSPGYAAAVAVEGKKINYKLYEWSY